MKPLTLFGNAPCPADQTGQAQQNREQCAAFVASCICQQGALLKLNRAQIKFSIRYALAVYDHGGSGATAYVAGIDAVRVIAGHEETGNDR